MSRNRYVRDYRLVETVNEKGRIHAVPEYIGAEYRFSEGWERVSGRLKRAAGICVLGWALYIAALIPVSAGMKTFYVSLPFIFTAVPLALTTGTVSGALACRGKPLHPHADRIENRYPASALFTAALPFAALIGEGISAISGKTMMSGDAALAAAAAALGACGVLLFRERKGFRCEKAGEPAGPAGSGNPETETARSESPETEPAGR